MRGVRADGPRTQPLAVGYVPIVYAFLFAPIVVLIIYSFNRRDAVYVAGLHVRLVPQLFANDELLDALIVTLEVAFVAVMSTVLGSLLGLGLARIRFRAAARPRRSCSSR